MSAMLETLREVERDTRDKSPKDRVTTVVTEGPWPKSLPIRPLLLDRQDEKRIWSLTRAQVVKLLECAEAPA